MIQPGTPPFGGVISYTRKKEKEIKAKKFVDRHFKIKIFFFKQIFKLIQSVRTRNRRGTKRDSSAEN
jgi:hypothetical protein